MKHGIRHLPSREECLVRCIKDDCVFWQNGACSREKLRGKSKTPRAQDVFLQAISEGVA